MKKILILPMLLACYSVSAQCTRTCKVTHKSPKTGKIMVETASVELVTGYTLTQRTGDAIYNGSGGKTIYAILTRENLPRITLKVKVGQGSELVWCSGSPCQVNCDAFNTYTVYDKNGDKGTIAPIKY